MAAPPQKLILDPKLFTIQVVNLTGMSSQTAESTLRKFGLQLGDTRWRESEQPARTIIDQTPKAGNPVVRGSRIHIVLAQPVSMVAAPNLSGMTRGRAEEALKNSRLGPLYAGDRESDQRAGTVANQTPQAGAKVRPRTVVQFWLAKPFPHMVVPNLIGLHRDQAERTLKDSKFNARYMEERESGWPAGTVIDQSPSAGASEKPGAVVQFHVAKPFTTVRVPDVRGMSRQKAESSLTSNQLRPEYAGEKESDGVTGKVVDQTPSARETVKPGTTAKFWLGKLVVPISVPNLIGMSHEEAKATLAALRESGLEPGGTEERESDRAAGTVLDQRPAGGHLVKRGTRVDVVLARPFSLVPVPDLVGMSHADPTNVPARLQNTGLQLGAVALRDSDQPIETVLEQDPAAGTLVERGARINLIVARLPAASGYSWPVTSGGAWLIAGAALLLASATLVLRKSVRSTESASSGSARVTATKDIGRQEVLSKAYPVINLDVRLRGRPDQGSQTLHMSVASDRGGKEKG